MTAWKRAGREPRQLINEWLASLQRVAADRGDHVVMRVNRNWIAFRSENQRRAFAEIRPTRHRVEVFILPERRSLSDPAGIARPSPRTQGWNWFRTKFHVVGNGHGKAALSLIRQSYETPVRARHRVRRSRQGGAHQARLPPG
jgi:predicted transport protein